MSVSLLKGYFLPSAQVTRYLLKLSHITIYENIYLSMYINKSTVNYIKHLVYHSFHHKRQIIVRILLFFVVELRIVNYF